MSKQIPNSGQFQSLPGFLIIAIIGFGSWVVVALIMLVRYLMYGYA